MATKRYNPDRAAVGSLSGVYLYLLALPLLPAALVLLMRGDAVRSIACGVGFALAMLAATMMRRGLVIAAEARRRKINRRTSTIPYKMTASIVLAAAMFVVARWGHDYAWMASLLFGGATFIGGYLYYGVDPSRKQGDLPAIGITSEEVIALLDEAEHKIAGIEKARGDIRNQEFRDRLRNITDGARDILATIEADPRDARAARKFLKVYLDGAEQVTTGYARTHADVDNPELEDNFRRVLGTIESVITEQQQKLSENNLSELDVQIEVLQMQLEKEGIT